MGRRSRTGTISARRSHLIKLNHDTVEAINTPLVTTVYLIDESAIFAKVMHGSVYVSQILELREQQNKMVFLNATLLCGPVILGEDRRCHRLGTETKENACKGSLFEK